MCSDDLTGFIPESVSDANQLDGSASGAWLVSGWIRHLPSSKWLAQACSQRAQDPNRARRSIKSLLPSTQNSHNLCFYLLVSKASYSISNSWSQEIDDIQLMEQLSKGMEAREKTLWDFSLFFSVFHID